MKIAFNISPLKTEHAFRGVGMYTKYLKESLLRYYPENEYVFFENNNFIGGNPDIIHYPFFDPFFITLPWRKLSKTVVTIHDLIPLMFPDRFPSGIKGKIKWAIQKILLNFVDAIITDSESSKKDIVRLIGISEKKVHVIYLAAGAVFKKLNLSKEKSEAIKKKFNLPNQFGLYVGDVTWNKNLPRILDAFNEMDIPLVLVGKKLVEKNIDRKNPWNKDLLQIQNKIDNKKYIALGFVEEIDLVKIYNLASVLVQPSIYEGFGLPILEAMACGCPVITARCGSLPEVAGDAAWYVLPDSTEQIKQGVRDVINNKTLRNNLIERGLQNVKNFSWKKTATRTLKIYETLI